MAWGGDGAALVVGVGLVLAEPGAGHPLGLPLQQVDLVQQAVVRSEKKKKTLNTEKGSYGANRDVLI